MTTPTAVSEEPAPAPEVEPPRLSTEELREILEERYSSACSVIYSRIIYPLIESVIESVIPYSDDDYLTEFTEFTAYNIFWDSQVRTQAHQAYGDAISSYMNSPSLSLHAECEALLEAHYITMRYRLTAHGMLEEMCGISLTYSDSWDESTARNYYPDPCDVYHPANYSV